jgi:hypothetical protein
VIPPGKGQSGDWQWWLTAVFVVASALVVIAGVVLLVG